MRRARVWLLSLAAAVAAGGCAAEDQPVRTLRLQGSAPAAQSPVPAAFVIDAVVKPGDGEFQSRLEGWFAAIAAPALSGEIEGSCVEKHCAVTVTLDSGKLALTGDFADAAGPTSARFVLKDDQDKPAQSGAATLAPLAGPVAGLGVLAAPDAIGEAGLDDLLMWAQQSVSTGSPPDDGPPTGSQRESLAAWQGQQGGLATGLIFASDLEKLRVDKSAAENAAGWTALGDPRHGWSAGYPAALLPVASQSGLERRFASADGKAVLTLAIDPPLSSDAFDAATDELTADRAGREGVNYTRVNGDLTGRWTEGGVVTVVAWRNREHGLARLSLTYPAAREAVFSPFETVVQRQLKVTDDLRP